MNKIAYVYKIAQIHPQAVEDAVRGFDSKQPFTLQDMVDMRLRDACRAGQSTFGRLAVADPVMQIGDEFKAKLLELHRDCTIPLGNRPVRKFLSRIRIILRKNNEFIVGYFSYVNAAKPTCPFIESTGTT